MADSFFVRVDKSVELTLDKLVSVDTGGEVRLSRKLFDTMAEAMLFAAFIGYREGKRIPVETPRDNSIDFNVFRNQNLDGYVYLFSAASGKSLTFLKDSEVGGAIRVFEEYSFGGLKVLDEWMTKNMTHLYESILNEMHKIAADFSVGSEIPKPKIIIKKRHV